MHEHTYEHTHYTPLHPSTHIEETRARELVMGPRKLSWRHMGGNQNQNLALLAPPSTRKNFILHPFVILQRVGPKLLEEEKASFLTAKLPWVEKKPCSELGGGGTHL